MDTCCKSSMLNAACSANPPKSDRQIIADAQRERLNHGLRTLASWCASRAMLEHDTETTLTMLEKKATELRGKCMKAGWAAIADTSQKADSCNTSSEHVSDADIEGEWTFEKCPKCSTRMLKNNVGDRWCSYVNCTYSITAP